MSKFQRYTYDPQTQVDKCLECKMPISHCNRCSSNPKDKHTVFLKEKVELLWEEGLSDEQMSERTNAPIAKIKEARMKLHLPPHGVDKKGRIGTKQVLALWEKGFTDARIARELNCSESTARRYRMKLNLPRRRRKGEGKL